ncbi:DUF2141 domain-containing protein [Flavobacteriaceae bacterium S356]|uniref:DUF2141 domain-containing protein n=1 Tax=Asprobacillus argus TaxID=3076534 RepID=A0ABU3LEH6_9FLAO|nr:DUF2141 domain-containing protein [Flavobacteriaceae bacterium S356]
MKIFATVLTAVMMFSAGITSTKKQRVTATVVNVSTDSGKVSFALYDKANFMRQPLQSKNGKIVDGKSTVTFENVAPGDYAIICFHDKNDNDTMDFETNGMPMEDYGATNNIMNFGPPKYDDAKFTVSDKDVTFEIKF